jgi:ATP-dependent RNA helicase HelY
VNEPSFAEKFARAKARRHSSLVDSFFAELDFAPDEFQERACEALAAGSSVLVAAPTGAGKTVVAEFAIHLAVQSNTKVFYTTPIKALSNQKFAELVARLGRERVGLLTGDNSVNSEAQVVVMTTEVLRNMIYAQSETLGGLGFVIMDEVHYLADRARGAVWEEVILQLDKEVRCVSLSATVSNAEEFGAWLSEVRGNTEIIVSEIRPVPLHQHVLFGEQILELFEPGSGEMRANPELLQRHNQLMRNPLRYRGQRTGGRQRTGPRGLRQLTSPEIVDHLDGLALLPAIFFIFSRAGCERAVANCVGTGLLLTSKEEQSEIRRVAEQRCAGLSEEDLNTLGYFEWLSGLERGIAAHHAGMLPIFKEVVEELFVRKLVKVVFATETLALGINMPARTVVLEKLEKFNGESRVPVTAGEFTQLTGRAGRRGIDSEGHAVVIWGEHLDPNLVTSLASKRSYPLNSSFRPSYNMVVNLLQRMSEQQAVTMLEASFAQFQSDRGSLRLTQQLREKQSAMSGYEKNLDCELGDFRSYAELRRMLTELERGPLPGQRKRGNRLKESQRQQVQRVASVRAELRSHPCHNCPDREKHARWGERWSKLKRETQRLEGEINRRGQLVVARFRSLASILTQLGYLKPEGDALRVQASGKRLSRIYGERDLLVAECIGNQIWSKLEPPSLAALLMALVTEGRGEERGSELRFPKGEFIQALSDTESIWRRLEDMQSDLGLASTPALNLDVCWATFRWAGGARLDQALQLANMLPGDFIRACKQLIDLLEQLVETADSELSESAYRAIDLVRRGIVAQSYFV